MENWIFLLFVCFREKVWAFICSQFLDCYSILLFFLLNQKVIIEIIFNIQFSIINCQLSIVN